jgi:hypothetical protein
MHLKVVYLDNILTMSKKFEYSVCDWCNIGVYVGYMQSI